MRKRPWKFSVILRKRTRRGFLGGPFGQHWVVPEWDLAGVAKRSASEGDGGTGATMECARSKRRKGSFRKRTVTP